MQKRKRKLFETFHILRKNACVIIIIVTIIFINVGIATINITVFYAVMRYDCHDALSPYQRSKRRLNDECCFINGFKHHPFLAIYGMGICIKKDEINDN